MRPESCDVSVVIPTYERPEWLERAVGSLSRQTVSPQAVFLVCRDTDTPTHKAIARVQALHAERLEIVKSVVSIPGHIPPVAQGLREGTRRTPWVAVLDDDAEAEPDWLRRLSAHFNGAGVGAVGGRYVNMVGESVAAVPSKSVFGTVDFWGRFIGNLYCDADVETPRDVDFLIGGNMAYRREVVEQLEFDLRLNQGVAYSYEVDLGLQVRNMGYRVVFDPTARVRHFSAPRAIAGMRRRTAESVRDYARNHTLIMGTRLPLAKRLVALAFFTLIGDRTGWGPGSAIVDMVLSRRFGWRGTFAAAQAGKLDGLRLLVSDMVQRLTSRERGAPGPLAGSHRPPRDD